MLKTFRTFGSTKASKVMLLVLAFCFVGWGVGDYLTKQVGNEAVTVNGQGLSVSELQRVYEGRMQQLQNLMGGRVSPEVLKGLNLDQVVLTEAVNRAIMRQSAYELKLMPAMESVRDEILAMQEFKGVNGAFDPDRYQSAVARAGLTTAAFEKSLAQDMSVRLLGELVVLKAPSANAVAPLLALENTRYTLEWLRLTPGSLPALPTPSDAQLQGFLTENANAFMVPEYRDVLVLPVMPADIAATTDVTEEQVAEYYTANKAQYEIPEKRAVRHILVETEKEATEVRARVNDIEAMTALAADFSTDAGSAKNGGNLGLIAKDDVVPAFGDVAFKLEVGEVSAPVQSPFGWHVIVVEKVDPAHTMELAQVRDGIVAALKDQVAEEALFDIQQQIDDKVAAGSTLEEIGTELGMAVRKLPRLAANDETLPRELQSAAFSVDAGDVAPPVEGTDGGVTYVQATSVTPAQEPALDDVRPRVTEAFMAAQRAAALQARGDAVLKAFEGGSTLEAAALKANVPGNRGELAFAQTSEAPEWLHPQLTRVMQVPTGGVLGSAIIDGQDVVIVRVAGRDVAQLDATRMAVEGQVYAQRLQQDYETMLIGELTRKAKVKTNEMRLKQVFGEETAVQ